MPGEEPLQKCLATWQRRLGLQDWTIRLDLRDPLTFTDRGLVDWNGDIRTATIVLRASNGNIEADLVHELVHLHFVDYEIALNVLEPFLGSIALDIAKRNMRVGIERAVERLSTALPPG